MKSIGKSAIITVRIFFLEDGLIMPICKKGIEPRITIINGFPLKMNKELLKYVVNEDAHVQV